MANQFDLNNGVITLKDLPVDPSAPASGYTSLYSMAGNLKSRLSNGQIVDLKPNGITFRKVGGVQTTTLPNLLVNKFVYDKISFTDGGKRPPNNAIAFQTDRFLSNNIRAVSRGNTIVGDGMANPITTGTIAAANLVNSFTSITGTATIGSFAGFRTSLFDMTPATADPYIRFLISPTSLAGARYWVGFHSALPGSSAVLPAAGTRYVTISYDPATTNLTGYASNGTTTLSVPIFTSPVAPNPPLTLLESGKLYHFEIEINNTLANFSVKEVDYKGNPVTSGGSSRAYSGSGSLDISSIKPGIGNLGVVVGFYNTAAVTQSFRFGRFSLTSW